MRIAKVKLKSKSPLSQSRFYEPDHPKIGSEKPDAYEKRTWRHRLHVNNDGLVYIPCMSFKVMLDDSARHLGLKFQGNVKFGSRFLSGVMCLNDMKTNIQAETVPGDWLHVPSDGKKGGAKRVLKCFPRIDAWEGETEIIVNDEAITNEIFHKHLVNAGNFVGLGRFRPSRGGYYGRFEVVDIQWTEAA